MTTRKPFRIPIFTLTCAFALLAAVSPAAAEDCLPCFQRTPDRCLGVGDDIYYAGLGEVVAGNDGDDKLYGNPLGNEKICGNWNMDEIYGDKGNDHVSGNAKADLVVGDPGNDYVYGGSGDDYLFGTNEAGFDTLNGNDGYDHCYYGEVYLNCECIFP